MNLEKEDYVDPRCALCGKPGEEETVQPVPVGRIMDKLREYEDRNDWPAVERHLKYWLAEAEANRDERGQLMLHNELMGYYRKQGKKDEAFSHAEKADYLVKKLEMEDTVTAGTTWVNAGTVREAFGDPVGGLEFFERARANYEKNLPDNDGRLGGLYNNMALSEESVEEYLETAEKLLNTESLPRNGYYAFVCEKCAPVFGHYGWFAAEAELKRRAEEINDRA